MPKASGAGVNVSVPVPGAMAGPALKLKVGEPLTSVTSKALKPWVPSSSVAVVGPTTRLVAALATDCAPESSATVTVGEGIAKDGGSFTGVTKATVKAALALPPSSSKATRLISTKSSTEVRLFLSGAVVKVTARL